MTSVFPRPRVRIAAIIAALALALTPAVLSDSAGAAGTGTISGVVTGESTVGWDGLVQVVLHPDGGGTIRTFTTGPTGAYSFTVPAGTSWNVSFEYKGTGNFLSEYYGGDGRVIGATSVPVADGSSTVIDAELALGGSITGALAGSAGPLSSATITASGGGTFPPNSPRTSFDPASGTYVVDRLHTSRYTLKFESTSDWKSEYWNNGIGVGTSIPTTAGVALTGYDVILDAVTVISGTITSAVDGLPLRSITATLYRDGTQVQIYNSGDDGSYKFADIGAGTFTVCFSNVYRPAPTGYPKAYQWMPKCYDDVAAAGEATPIVLAQGARADGIDVALSRNGSLSGSVTVQSSGDPSPIWHARVLLWEESPADSGDFQQTEEFITEADGQFVFDDLAPGNYIVRADDGDLGVYGSRYYPNSRYFSQAEVISVDIDIDVALDPFRLVVKRFEIERLFGATRFETGVAISQATFPGAPADDDPPRFGVPVIYIANGANFPDALSAGPAAIAQGGGLLLVRPDAIPDAVRDELGRLQPEKIVVVGGLPSVGATVYEELKAYVSDPEDDLIRLAGADRYETSERVVRYAFGEASPNAVFIATGQNFPDALAAGPAAGAWRSPVILVNGGSNALSPDAQELITDLQPQVSYVVGGYPSVSAGVESSIESAMAAYATPNVERFAGENRYETAFYINQLFAYETENAFLAVGAGFADALAGGPLAGALGAPLYLSEQGCVPQYVIEDMVYLNVQRVVLLGGLPSLSSNVENLVPC